MSFNIRPEIRIDLVEEKNDVIVTTSVQIAESFGKLHKHVIERIEQLVKDDEKIGRKVGQSFYYDSYNRKQKMYLLDRDAFTFVVQKFTGKKAYEWQWKYIEAFNQMERILVERHSSEWQLTREKGKMVRRSEADQIALFIDYATKQGSSNAKMYYVNFSKVMNKALGVNAGERELMTLDMLVLVSTLENQIMHKVKEGMNKNLFYKDIFQEVKGKVNLLTEILTVPEDKYLPGPLKVKDLIK